MSKQLHKNLKRLPQEFYIGNAFVHWSLTMQNRQTGWLTGVFYYKFRELLTHTLFRYGLTCPIYCCMPDHIHLLWIGLFSSSNQLNAMKYFRRQINLVLRQIGFSFQSQCYDNVMLDKDRERHEFENVCEYVARNPERKGLVEIDSFRSYKFTDCLFPGTPDLHFNESDYWDSFWQIYSYSVKNGLSRG